MTTDPRRRTVLIIDDDEDFRELVATVLPATIETLQAARLRDADALLQTQDVDTIVVDGLLPDGSGPQWIENRRKAGDTRPIVFISAFYKDSAIIEQMRGMGVSTVDKRYASPETILNAIFKAQRSDPGSG